MEHVILEHSPLFLRLKALIGSRAELFWSQDPVPVSCIAVRMIVDGRITLFIHTTAAKEPRAIRLFFGVGLGAMDEVDHLHFQHVAQPWITTLKTNDARLRLCTLNNDANEVARETGCYWECTVTGDSDERIITAVQELLKLIPTIISAYKQVLHCWFDRVRFEISRRVLAH